MAALKIPERYRPGLLALLALTDDQIERMINALAKEAPSTDAEQLSAQVTATMVGAPPGADQVVEALASLYSYRGYADAGLESTVEGIGFGITRGGSNR